MNAIKIPSIEECRERMVEKIQEETTIIATKTNVELITTFFEANHLIPGIEVSTYKKVLISVEDEGHIITEKFYNAICIKYAVEDLHIGILLLNLSAKHHGLNNMLIDYLKRLKVQPIIIDMVFIKPVTPQEVDNNFLINVVPKLKNLNSSRLPMRKSYAEVKE